ncbi:MAG: serine/threonine protein kinase [Myxococcaceae bacterium]|nr:serine/threonine protein kinase [Myxococcaceae bacterium]
MENSRRVSPAALPAGTVVGSWCVVSQRGRGSYGAVYRAEKVGDVGAGPFALKVALYPWDPRFEREGELLSRIHHPHVPGLHERGWWTGPGGQSFPYLVMDWIEGVQLYEWASRHRLTSRQALRLLAQVARALEATHGPGVDGVHRDVKGENVLVREDAHAVLTDFGSGLFRGASTITRQQPPPGTPQYQSPESLRFQFEHLRQPSARYEARPADDVYALGLTAYRLVTGRYPPATVELEETEEGNRLIHLPLEPPEKWVTLSPELAALIRRMLANEPAARGTAGEVAQAAERAAKRRGRAADRPIALLQGSVPSEGLPWLERLRSARTWRKALLAAAAGALVVGGLWGTAQREEERPQEVAQVAQEEGKEDGGTTGLVEATLESRVGEVAEEPGRVVVGVEVPSEPVPGQRLRPCKKPDTEINGGCWKRLADEVPPCADNSYEWENRCYSPSMAPAQPATSDPP